MSLQLALRDREPTPVPSNWSCECSRWNTPKSLPAYFIAETRAVVPDEVHALQRVRVRGIGRRKATARTRAPEAGAA